MAPTFTISPSPLAGSGALTLLPFPLLALAEQLADVDTDADRRSIGFLAIRSLEKRQQAHAAGNGKRTEVDTHLGIEADRIHTEVALYGVARLLGRKAVLATHPDIGRQAQEYLGNAVGGSLGCGLGETDVVALAL